MKNIFITLAILFTLSGVSIAQVVSSDEAQTSGGGGLVKIKKLYQAALSPINSGNTFPYQISFSVSGTVSNLVITDILPSQLEYVGESSYPWLTAAYSSGTVTWTSSGSVAPGAYSIVLNVRFKFGVTCDGDTADNIVSVKADNMPEVRTKPITITASASDGWKISKRPKNNIYTYLTGSTVTYDIALFNSLGFNGSINLTNVAVTDLFPSGAVLSNNTCSTFPLLDVAAAGSGSPYFTPYTCSVDVTYPSSAFPDGSCPVNKVEMTGSNHCDQSYSFSDSVQVCMVDSIPVVAGASVQKYLSVVNPVAGCVGFYQMVIHNSGNTTITDFDFIDAFPAGLEIDNMNIYSASSTPFDFSYTTNLNSGTVIGQSNFTFPNPSPSFYTSLQVQPVSIGPGEILQITAYFKIGSSLTAGQTITNTATLTSAANSISESSSVSFVVLDSEPKIKVRKEICSPTTGNVYFPGDELVYRIGFQNYGSGTFNGGVLTDILDPRLELVSATPVSAYQTNQNTTAYPPCNGGAGTPTGTTDITSSITSNFTVATNTLSVTLPNIPSDCQSIYWVNSGYNLIPQVPTYWVEFKVKVKDGTPPGNILNQGTVSNAILTANSNTPSITVNSLYQLKAQKELSIDGGTTYTTSATIVAGSTVKYRLTLTNSGNMNLTNINLVDILPNIGDQNLLLCTPRNSTVNTTLLGPLSTSANTFSRYSTILNPDVFPELGATCGSTPAAWSSAYSNLAKSILVSTVPSFILPPGASEVITFDLEIPITATSADSVCNNFAIRGEDMQGTTTTSFLSNEVCLKIEEFVPKECCETELDIKKEKQSLKNFPNGDSSTGGVPASIGKVNFVFNSPSGIPITEFNARVIDFNFSSKLEECPNCNNNPALWGSIENLSGTNIGGLLYDDANPVLPPIRKNQRELQWKKPTGYAIQAGDSFELDFLFPPFTSLRCCRNNAFVCVEFSWKDANCMVCRELVCFSFSLRNTGGLVMQSVRMNPNSLGLPRLSTEQIEAIEEPETGMLLWDADMNTMKVFDGENWKNVGNE